MAHPRTFRFGIQTSNTGSATEWRTMARRIESQGYSTLFLPDHFVDCPLAPVPALAAAAEATSTLRIGSLVFDNDYKHPVVLAKEAATLDLLSDGRLELGLGAGWMTVDYEQSGIPLDAPGVRIDRMIEGLTIIKGLMLDEPFSFTGEHYTISGLRGQPRPVQTPHPPIIIGGGSKRILSVAAQHADIIGLNASLRAGTVGPEAAPSVTPKAFDDKVAWVRAAAGDRFDELELNVLNAFCVFTDDRRGMAEQLGGGFNLSPEEALGVPVVLIGTVDQMIDDLIARRERYGISYVVVHADVADRFAAVVERLAGT